MSIPIKSAADVEGMRIAGRLASEVLDMLTPHVVAGVTTEQLDKLAHDHIVDVQGAVPAPLNYAPPGYTPYPKSICTSINHQVCHGIPNDRPLKNGDIVNIDVTVIKDGWHGDTSRMFIVGEGSIAAKRLVQMTYDAMWKGIEKVRPGAFLGDIGMTIKVLGKVRAGEQWAVSGELRRRLLAAFAAGGIDLPSRAGALVEHSVEPAEP
jgi:methionyl aminopeptidase